jgi:hypothetical protein
MSFKALNRSVALSVAALMLSTAVPVQAKEDLRVSWLDLPAFTNGKTIALVLPDGSNLQGKVIGAEASQLIFKVSKTSNVQSYPKGNVTIPRASVRSFSMNRSGALWKAVGSVIGLGAGLAVAVPVNAYSHNEGDGAPLAVALIIIVPVVLGFLIGRSADKKTVTVTLAD